LLTDPYRAGERPFAPVFTLNDVLSGIDATQIAPGERNLKAIEAACRRLGCRPIKRDGLVVRMRLGGNMQQNNLDAHGRERRDAGKREQRKARRALPVYARRKSA